MTKKLCRDFNSARSYAQKFNFKNKEVWKKHTTSKIFPKDIPVDPQGFYGRQNVWTSWGDFLGNKTIANQNRTFLPFKDAQKIVNSWKLKSRSQWRQLIKQNKIPPNIPRVPEITYGKQFQGFGKWLGTGVIANQNREFLSFEDAIKILKKEKIRTRQHYDELQKKHKLPNGLPANPPRTYKKEWKSWPNYLGSGNIAKSEVLSWPKAKKLYQKLSKENNITTWDEWVHFIKNNTLPKGLPKYPRDAYTKSKIQMKIK